MITHTTLFHSPWWKTSQPVSPEESTDAQWIWAVPDRKKDLRNFEKKARTNSNYHHSSKKKNYVIRLRKKWNKRQAQIDKKKLICDRKNNKSFRQTRENKQRIWSIGMVKNVF